MHAPSALLRVIRPDGSADPAHDPRLEAETIRALYRAMVRTRLLDERLGTLSQEGRIGFHPTAIGREAAVVGTAGALREGDWLFPTSRDFGAALLRGMPVAEYLHQVYGSSQDRLHGRQMPGAFSGRSYGLGSVSAPAATHLPHAVGFAWAARRRGEDVVTAALFDGAEIDAADFHTGLNFAGVWRAPTIFAARVAQDQSAAEHAVAYGIASARCDGDDVLAVFRAVRDALERATRGEGATVLDLVESQSDPLERTRVHLERLGVWKASDEQALRAEVHEAIDHAILSAAHAGPPALRALFQDVFAEVPRHLSDQLDEATRLGARAHER
ncbi:MAG: thiamine pyrophosphate-dependent dehydrogenase E1 component subunit alpha [Sandaracinaceae bacterium]|nr:thiamine pyrophosphate-dependent dehydrogenase E1 component subunit alpha [Sandaracinaceae bacterium]